jgi:hypothetical protein
MSTIAVVQSETDIFVSYSSEDRARVLPLVESLMGRGIRALG